MARVTLLYFASLRDAAVAAEGDSEDGLERPNAAHAE